MNGFVLDEASGCFYSSALGYYFNPATQLFRDACSGLWYRYSEETGTYQLVESA
jgi:outer membrane protease